MFQQKLFSLGGFHLKSTGFHEIRRISYGFHEIRRISYGFHTDFMKSGGFHEIRRISCEIERPLARNCNPMFSEIDVFAIHTKLYAIHTYY